jgi:putative transcriptional regulator
MFDDLKKGLSEVDAFLSGKQTGYKVSVPEQIDVKSIRQALHMTQAGFSNAFGFSLDAVKHWEGARRTPEAPIRAYLKVISRNPKAVLAALQDKEPRNKRANHARTRETDSAA